MLDRSVKMKKTMFIVSICALALSGCSCPKTCIQSCPVCPAQAVQPMIQTSGKSVTQATCEQKGGKWYSTYIQSNWGIDGLLFYFVEGKNKYIDTSYYNETPTGYSATKKLLDLHLSEKETINLCLKRIGTKDYTLTAPQKTYDAVTRTWKNDETIKKATSFNVIESESYNCTGSRCLLMGR